MGVRGPLARWIFGVVGLFGVSSIIVHSCGNRWTCQKEVLSLPPWSVDYVYCFIYCSREMYRDKVCIDLLVLWNIYDKTLFGKDGFVIDSLLSAIFVLEECNRQLGFSFK